MCQLSGNIAICNTTSSAINDGGYAVISFSAASDCRNTDEGDSMAGYLARACTRCNGYVGIIIRDPGRNVPLQAVNVTVAGVLSKSMVMILRLLQLLTSRLSV